ncbi:DUF4350 domain-containing protein [Kibdelosporangium phytohabitans]|uniref:DUF4350 domain-containing protein n=1 Tax=Kibdelosporangium phytohabitans TaxID=860235 RepID=A0A0N9HYZ8_9PSEU|nr:DUF4350 domain-containing protein [Kibdelosporangium phytohabitans]ALG07398.1 hypothetical protein AOZ06_11110 [Kibdelosporangium phytohabitans]MBE1471719.1 hypothetical protein [Kibdelosporangium phytohabitans]
MTVQTSVSPGSRRIWRAARGPALIGAIIVAAAIVITLLRGGGTDGAVDPGSVTPAGSRAIARLLEAQGVEVIRVDSLESADSTINGDTTLLITQPNWLAPDQLTALRRKARTLVAIGASNDALTALAPSVRENGTDSPKNREPGCDFAAAGVARLGGVLYRGSTRCYDGALVLEDGVTLLGDATPLTNEQLDGEGNAALSMRLLGQHQRLVWYLPSLADATAGAGVTEKSFYDLVPVGWWFGLGQAGVAVLLFMVWRARRLGPIVAEPLPVVVRAAETTEGRARLYRRAKATDHAADALRAATLGRLIPVLGLPADATPTAIVEGITARTRRQGNEIHAVLFGPPPNTEQALVQLADALDALADEVGSH